LFVLACPFVTIFIDIDGWTESYGRSRINWPRG
jgi:hypothetical protein